MNANSTAPPLLAIFDHDGVLVDSLALHQQGWVEMGRREGLPVTAELIRETFGRTNIDIFRQLLGDGPTDDDLKRFEARKEACYRESARGQIVLMPGVRELLDGLTADGFRLAIGSSAVRANLDLTVEQCGLAGRFSAIASVEDIRRGKPDPEVFMVAAARAGVDPRGTVVFEDAPVGIQAAKAAGMLAVGVGTHHPLSTLLVAGADLAVPNLVDFDRDALRDRLRVRVSCD